MWASKRKPFFHFYMAIFALMISEKIAGFHIFPEQEVQGLKALLGSPRRIVITTHKNPDGDALGSSLGLWHVLVQLGHDAVVVSPNAFDHFLAWMPGSKQVVNAYKDMEGAGKLFENAEVIFCLDFSASRRVGEIEQFMMEAQGQKVMVDHHIDPEGWPDFLFHVEGISSTAELIFRLVSQMGHGGLVNKDVAECLYTGLMTDTGSFRFSSTTADVHRIVAELLDRGLDVGRIHNLVYDNFRESRMRFIGHLLLNKLKVLPEFKTSYITISIDEIKRFRVKAGDTEGIVNYNLSLKGVNFGVLMKETPEGTKLSFRSIGRFPCNEFAAHFNGGGHANASGGKVDLSLAETEAMFIGLLEEYKKKLHY